MHNRIRLLAAAVAAAFSIGAQAETSPLGFSRNWTFDHGTTTAQNAEIAAFDALNGNLWIAGGNGVDVLSVATGNLVQHIAIPSTGSINSIAIYNGVAAFAVESSFAFIGLERTTKSAVAIYDITDPANAKYVDMIVSDGDVSPEGLLTFSMNGMNYLAIANEVSKTTSLYNISPVPEAESYAMFLAGLGMIGWMSRRRKIH